MTHWWEVATADQDGAPTMVRAVAYYRHSAQDRQENSIPIQRDQVHEWAEKNGVDIIKEFADHGKSGLTVEGRPEFTEMMDKWVKQRDDFDYVLCLDVSRWGRFQDIDRSAQYSAECKKHKKQVIYTTIGKPKEDDPLYPVYVQFERFRAAQYSKELSDKVWRGCMKIAEQGYWAGGPPPYGMQRLLLDEKREPLHTLKRGQHKGIQNQRVTLIGGDSAEAKVVKQIFHEFVELGYSEFRIAERLNADSIPSPGGRRWGAGSVIARLKKETYVGTLLYNRTSQKLKTPTQLNPQDKWVRTPEAFEGIISLEQFLKAQEILEQRRRKYDPEHMLGQLDTLYKQYGVFRSSLIRLLEDAPSPSTFAKRFEGLDTAFQQMFNDERDRVRQEVHERICLQVPEVLKHTDFLVLDKKLTLSIQPTMPIPHGYSSYWPVRRDARHVIDLTLGVLLSDPKDCDIRGQNHARSDGRVVRPQLVMVDDPQTTESAWSPSQSQRREAILAGDVLGMAGGRSVRSPRSTISKSIPATA